MAGLADAATDRVSRTTAPSLAGVTFTCWAKINATHAGNLFHPMIRVEAGGGTAAIFSFRGTNGRTPTLYSASSTTGIAGAEQALSTWVFLAFTMNSGPAQLFYGTTPGSLTKVTGTVNTSGTPDTVTLFGRSPSDGSEWLEGTLAYVRMWTAVLSDAEVAAESQSTAPVRTSGLWASWALAAAALTDGSGNGRNLTAGSTALSSATDPPLGTTINGSGTASAQPGSSAGAAAAIVAGTGAAVATPATAAGTAGALVQGAGAAAATSPTSAGSAAVLVRGSGTAAALAVTAAGSAGALVQGAGTAAASPAAAVGTAGALVTGTGTASAQQGAGAGAGAVRVTGSGGAVAPLATAAGSSGALEPVTGSGAAAAAPAVASASGAVVVSGSGAAAAPYPAAAGTAVAVAGGDGAAAAASVTATGLGKVIVSASGAAVAPAAVSEGSPAKHSSLLLQVGEGRQVGWLAAEVPEADVMVVVGAGASASWLGSGDPAPA